MLDQSTSVQLSETALLSGGTLRATAHPADMYTLASTITTEGMHVKTFIHLNMGGSVYQNCTPQILMEVLLHHYNSDLEAISKLAQDVQSKHRTV